MKGFASIASLLCVAFMSVSAAPEGAVLELIKQGRKAYASRDWDEAIRFFSAAIERDKEEDEAYVGRALTYVKKGSRARPSPTSTRRSRSLRTNRITC